ncbi:MAG: hypothetical protein A2Y33_08530 [Spirochaetes bacterium GWF1_51_8]|nr:MAG: hypothetical protein A2Y33_08530 [Spirochaetes bacterium GWF1_51_8]
MSAFFFCLFVTGILFAAYSVKLLIRFLTALCSSCPRGVQLSNLPFHLYRDSFSQTASYHEAFFWPHIFWELAHSVILENE